MIRSQKNYAVTGNMKQIRNANIAINEFEDAGTMRTKGWVGFMLDDENEIVLDLEQLWGLIADLQNLESAYYQVDKVQDSKDKIRAGLKGLQEKAWVFRDILDNGGDDFNNLVKHYPKSLGSLDEVLQDILAIKLI